MFRFTPVRAGRILADSSDKSSSSSSILCEPNVLPIGDFGESVPVYSCQLCDFFRFKCAIPVHQLSDDVERRSDATSQPIQHAILARLQLTSLEPPSALELNQLGNQQLKTILHQLTFHHLQSRSAKCIERQLPHLPSPTTTVSAVLSVQQPGYFADQGGNNKNNQTNDDSDDETFGQEQSDALPCY